jgi:hypothetical protein
MQLSRVEESGFLTGITAHRGRLEMRRVNNMISQQHQDETKTPRIPSFSMAGGPSCWFIDGKSGIATWRQEEPVPDPAPSCRPYVVDYPAGTQPYNIGTANPARLTWPNVEMTCYARFYGVT